MSKLAKAISAVKTQLPAHQKAFVHKTVRVDQAGELAADLIYAGQYAVFSYTNPRLAPLIKHMWQQEIQHHTAFDALQSEGRVRPSLLTPVWKVAATGLGVATALMGKEAAMACTEAVETVIGGHYNDQLREFARGAYPQTPEFDTFKKMLSEFRDDELEHLETAVENDSHKAVPYMLLTETIKAGCRVAINVAKTV